MGKDFLVSPGSCPPGFVLDPISGTCVPLVGGGGGSLSDVVLAINAQTAILRSLLDEFRYQFDIPGSSVIGQINGFVDFNPNGTVTTTAAQLYVSPKKVRRATIINLSTTDNYTLTSAGLPGRPSAINAAGKGVVLNKALAAGQGGGSFTIGNIDLSAFTIISDTNTGQNVAVYYEL